MRSAKLVNCARILTGTVNARVSAGALSVTSAPNLLDRFNNASWNMVVNHALGVWWTIARVAALFVYASQMVGAVRVHCALWPLAFYSRISKESHRASAPEARNTIA